MARLNQLVIPLTVGAALSAGSAFADSIDVQFGSSNDGLGGFTQSTVNGDYVNSNSGNTIASEIWTTDTDRVQYRNQNQGTLNSSFLREVPITRTAGYYYTVTGVVTFTDGYVDDNNRVGIYLFGDSPEVSNEDEAGAIGLIFNTDDSSLGGSPGSNNPDAITLREGIDSTPDFTGAVTRNQTTTPYAQDLVGTDLSLSASLNFRAGGVGEVTSAGDVLAGGELVVDIIGMLTEETSDETLTGTVTVLASDYTGDSFGFVTRARARNFNDTVAGSDTGRSLPWVMDYRSFTITESVNVIPEPASIAVMGFGGLMLMRRRRRA